jgi:hypothetical protein
MPHLHGCEAGARALPGEAGALALAPMKTTFSTTLDDDMTMGVIRLPFAPRDVFGKARPPVRVTLNGYTYRSTVFDMGDGPFVPLRMSNREAAGVSPGQTLDVTLELDADKREVAPPDDLLAALQAAPGAMDGWALLSFTFQREHVEGVQGAKRPETRTKRIGLAVDAALARATKAAR